MGMKHYFSSECQFFRNLFPAINDFIVNKKIVL